MAVQKSKKSRSRRDHRRGHIKAETGTVCTDATTGERHLRHHVTECLYYRGQPMLGEASEES